MSGSAKDGSNTAQAEGGVDVDLPDPRDDPLEAAYAMLHHVRDEMSGDLYDEHEEVRDWAMSIEWAYTAVAEHEDFDD